MGLSWTVRQWGASGSRWRADAEAAREWAHGPDQWPAIWLIRNRTSFRTAGPPGPQVLVFRVARTLLSTPDKKAQRASSCFSTRIRRPG